MLDKIVSTERSLKKERLQALINERLEDTLFWLSKAYEARPSGDKSERVLLDVMASLQKMQREVNQAFIRGVNTAESRF